MESRTSRGVMAHLFPSLGPALVISMGYIDLGKWLAAVDGGVRFGNDLVLLVLFFNLAAILCQYLATCVGIVTRKNLAQICSVEYSRTTCMILGVQYQLSMITSDLTMILGVAHGFNLLFGVNILGSICFAAVASVLLPIFVDLLVQNDRKAEALYESLAGFALLLYVLGVLISQPEIPLPTNVTFPKLSGENAYSLMALLGANIMAHNFYIHSSIVQQKRLPNVPVTALLHDHFFAILFIFTGIFVVNYVLMNSAAAVFGITGIELKFEDVSLLMDQIFWIPIAPVAIFLVLVFSSQITALTWNIDGQEILQYFFGANISVWVQVLLVKALSVIPALCCAKCAGTEGIFQLLIFCQVIQAMLLPSSVIPLFRVASSQSIMGAFKISWYLGIVALLAFFGMLASNVIFITEMLFGNSSWINDLRGGMSNGGIATCAAFLLVACVSMCFMLYLTVTPLKSASDKPETDIGMLHSRMDELELSRGRKDDVQDKIATNEDMLSVESALEITLEHHDDKSFLDSNIDQSDTAINPDHDCHQPTHDSVASDTAIDPDHDCHQLTHDSVASDAAIDPDHDCHQPTHGISASDTFSTAMFQNEELKSVNEIDLETLNKTSSASLLDPGVVERQESDQVQKDLTLKADISRDKDNEEVLVAKESVTKSLPPLTSEDSGSFNPVQVKVSDGGIGNESSSKSSGLGRSSRRQLAIILDEFWGHLFDFHGKPTQEAIGQKYDALLGLNLKTVSSIKVDVGTESSINFCTDADRGAIFSPNSMDYGSPKRMNMSKGELSYGFRMGSPSRSRNIQILNTRSQALSSRQLDSNERPYSSLYLPQCSDNHDYQPATVHGYQIASYVKEIGSGRTPYLSNVSLDSPKISKSPPSIPPGFEDSVLYGDRQNGLGSLATSSLQSPKMPRVRRVQVEGPYFNPSLIEPSENAGSSSCTKKYHSSPDISALIAASRNLLLNEANSGGPIGQPSLGRMISQQQHYLNPISKTGVSLAFDELYQPKLHRDVLPLQSKLNPDTRSLWSRQPFEQLFGMPNGGESRGDRAVTDKLSSASEELLSCADSELKLLQSLRFCITKLLKLEGSDWLFRHNGGCDEELICKVSTTEKYIHKAGANDMNQLHSNRLQYLSSDQRLSSVQRNEEADTPYSLSLPNCGDGCVWQASLVVSFGVWCIHRILELSHVESRPELWGKYTYVLNRLQGILDLAFSRPRNPLSTCSCLELAPEGSNQLLLSQHSKPIRAPFTTASMILEIIKDVEIAVSGRKGRTGTAAGDVAFPKGKENLASVLKRYKRRLSNRNT
ncbi:unnamed protein product [Musa acuminata subsp. malaccensis]|uniref:(wild Malaysian banana) hypothetical protein n=1 Tax=Musa acuminata subsp. malaccensis TaxID=214687 RepID=A0A8D6ZRJ5_MUSAM|nr:unnamed protein product [Musa acuminata subsp. malaccensis]